jgi:hypothetical protein
MWHKAISRRTMLFRRRDAIRGGHSAHIRNCRIGVLIVPGFIRGTCSYLVQRFVQPWTGTGEILQQLRLMGELDQESLMGVRSAGAVII